MAQQQACRSVANGNKLTTCAAAKTDFCTPASSTPTGPTVSTVSTPSAPPVADPCAQLATCCDMLDDDDQEDCQETVDDADATACTEAIADSCASTTPAGPPCSVLAMCCDALDDDDDVADCKKVVTAALDSQCSDAQGDYCDDGDDD